MTLKDIIDKLRGIEQEEEKEELPDDETRDKFLRSLRREDRLLDEEEEKIYLKKKIADRKRLNLRKNLFGIKVEIHKKQALLAAMKKKKKVNVLANENPLLKERSLLNNKRDEFRKTKSKSESLLDVNYKF